MDQPSVAPPVARGTPSSTYGHPRTWSILVAVPLGVFVTLLDFATTSTSSYRTAALVAPAIMPVPRTEPRMGELGGMSPAVHAAASV